MPKLESVIDFIVRATPRPVLELYAVLAEFEYPINDKATLDEAIESRIAGEGLDAEAGKLFGRLFTLADFPLASAQNALEKFNFRLPPGARIVPLHGHLVPWSAPVGFPVDEPLPEEARLPFYVREGIVRYWRRLECQRRCDETLESCLAGARDVADVAGCVGANISCRRSCG